MDTVRRWVNLGQRVTLLKVLLRLTLLQIFVLYARGLISSGMFVWFQVRCSQPVGALRRWVNVGGRFAFLNVMYVVVSCVRMRQLGV